MAPTEIKASEDDPLYYHSPSRTLVYIFSLYSHHPWNTWSTQVNMQYANLEDKEVTQRLAIYRDQSSTAIIIHFTRHFSVTNGRSTDFHRGDSGVRQGKTEGAGKKAK